MSKDEYGGIWVYAEHWKQKLPDVALELLGEGRKLADKKGAELAAVLVGYQLSGLAEELFACGADKVYLADSDALSVYRSDLYTRILEDAVTQYKPEVLLFGATCLSADLAPRLGARLRTGLTSDCVGLDMDEDGQLVQTVPAFGGTLMADVICPQHRPQMATVRPGIMKKPNKRVHEGIVIPLDIAVEEQALVGNVRVVDVVSEPEQPHLALEQAEVVIGGGYGVGSSENWHLVSRLGKALGAAICATRPAVDEGWALEEQMVGQSGKVIRPKLYIAIGISGAVQHMVGVEDSEIIVAINNDPQAPILKQADICVIQDFREFVPHLIKELELWQATVEPKNGG